MNEVILEQVYKMHTVKSLAFHTLFRFNLLLAVAILLLLL